MRNSRIGTWPICNSKLSEISASNYDCELKFVMQLLLFSKLFLRWCLLHTCELHRVFVATQTAGAQIRTFGPCRPHIYSRSPMLLTAPSCCQRRCRRSCKFRGFKLWFCHDILLGGGLRPDVTPRTCSPALHGVPGGFWGGNVDTSCDISSFPSLPLRKFQQQ